MVARRALCARARPLCTCAALPQAPAPDRAPAAPRVPDRAPAAPRVPDRAPAAPSRVRSAG
eukprot:6022809-Prymnesium_polylepis.1